MVTLNTNPAERRHGTQVKEGRFMANPRTNNLVTALEPDTCFMCEAPVIDGFCKCNVGNSPVETPAYEPQLLRVDADHYTIDSFKTPGVTYNLSKNEFGAWVCSCPRHAFKLACKHVDYLLDNLLDQRGVSATYAHTAPSKPKLQLEDLYSFVDGPTRTGRVKEAW